MRWEDTLSYYEHRSVATTFNCQLDVLGRECPDASNLLKVLAFLDPEGISLDMLTDGATALLESQSQVLSRPSRKQWLRTFKDKVLRWRIDRAKFRDHDRNTTLILTPKITSLLAMIQSPIDLRTAIMQLRDHSLILVQSQTLHIHDLIQLVVRENAKEGGHDQDWFRCAVDIVCRAFGKINDHRSPQSWPRCEPIVPHIQSLRSRRVISRDGNIQLVLASQNLGRYLQGRGRYVEAATLFCEVMVDMQQIYGLESLSTLCAMDELAWSYKYCGRFNDAGKFCEQVLRAKETCLGPEHIGTVGTRYRLALIRIDQERYDEAEALLKEALACQERQIGKEHRNTLCTVYGLSRVYYCKGLFTEAQGALARVQQGLEGIVGAAHRDTLEVVCSLAVVSLSQKRYSDAEALFKRVLLGRQQLLGPEHVLSLATMGGLALAYNSQGRHDEGEELLRKMLLGVEQQVGSDHPHTLLAKRALAEAYRAQERYAEAEALLLTVGKAGQDVLGPSHGDTPASERFLASLPSSIIDVPYLACESLSGW